MNNVEQIDWSKFVADRPGLEQIKKEANEAIACYYGGTPLEKLVEKFSSTEDQEKYNWRVKAVVRNFDNYVKEINSQYIEGVFRPGGVKRDVGDQVLQVSVDTGYLKFVKRKLLPMSLLLPEMYVKVCLPVHDETSIKTKQDKIEKKIIPYPSLVFPHHVVAFDANDDGRLNWITLKVSVGKDDPVYEVYDSINKFTVKKNKEGRYELNENKPHGFKSVPFVRLAWTDNNSVDGHPKPGYSMMFDVVNKTIGALTWLSMLHESGLFHLFPKLVTDARTFDAIQKAGGDISTNKVIKEELGPDGELPTRYLNMPSTEFDILDKIFYERIPTGIYRAARLRDRSTDKEQSGVAKMFDMVPEMAVLVEVAAFFQSAEQSILSIMAEGWTESAPNVTVQYPNTFDVKSINELLKETGELVKILDDSSLPSSETAGKLIVKNIYRRMLQDADPKLLESIYKEIDNAKPEDVHKKMKAPIAL